MKDPKTLIDRYVAAVNAKDKTALLGLYADDMRIFDMMAPWQHRSAESFGTLVDQWFKEAGKTPETTLTDVDIRHSGDLAVITCLIEYADRNEKGERNSMWNRLTWVLVPDGDDWKIQHEHTSAPLDGDTPSGIHPLFDYEGAAND